MYATLNCEQTKSKRSTRRKEQNKRAKKLSGKKKSSQLTKTGYQIKINQIKKKQGNTYQKQGKIVAWLRTAGDSWYDKILWRRDRARQRQYIHQRREHRWKQSGLRGDSDRWHKRKGKWPEMRGELLFKIKHEIHKTKKKIRQDIPHHGVTPTTMS